MATYELNLPVDDAQIEKLKVGDIIYPEFTGRF